jgi:hypothetical protein
MLKFTPQMRQTNSMPRLIVRVEFTGRKISRMSPVRRVSQTFVICLLSGCGMGVTEGEVDRAIVLPEKAIKASGPVASWVRG